MTPVLELSRDDDIVCELLAPYARVEPVTLRRRPARRWRGKFALAAVALALTGMIAAVAVAGTGWLVGSPAPANVKTDFGSYATQLGFNPQPGQAMLVASNGAYQLYATLNNQGGACILVSTPWRRPGPNGEGGDCSANSPDSTPFWAGTGGMASTSNSSTTLVLYGHTTDKNAASVQFDDPDGNPVTAPVGQSGFFIAAMNLAGSMCDWGTWTPSFTLLDGNDQQLSTASETILPGAKWYTVSGRGRVCAAVAKGPFGQSRNQLNPSH